MIELIPQKPPFLFVDKVLDRTEKTIICEKQLTGSEDFFKGHFPEMPVMPGVLLLESMFQSGALLMANPSALKPEIAVVSRVNNTRFKNLVKPPATLTIHVELLEQLENAFYMKGKILVDNKLVASTDFTCTRLAKDSP